MNEPVMSIEIESPRRFYSEVNNIVSRIIEKLSSTSQDEQIELAKASSRDLLTRIHDQISEQLESLEKHAEWKTFTIALYGETNAGKSTIIETLRIMLEEQSKQEAQQAFRAWQKSSGITQDVIDLVRQSILDAERNLSELEDQLQLDLDQYKLENQSLKKQLKELQQVINSKRQAASLWQKFLWLLQSMPEEREYSKLNNALSHNQSQEKSQLAEHKLQQQKLNKTIKDGEVRHHQLEQQMAEAAPLADGTIIGNGRSDFTLDTQRYHFQTEQHQFALLDVPGIEGKESKVMDSIWSAVQKAHAVFYVTSKASAPQKGENGSPGTLEKIKQHLGAQTEVWAIYNKRITNPIQLERGELLSRDETESLRDFDQKMSEQLGENYRRCVALSAYPAFLSVADCLLPGSPGQRNKSKFLRKFSPDEVLTKTKLEFFTEMLGSRIVSDYKAKIQRSNINKINGVVNDASLQVTQLRTQKFTPLVRQLEDELADTHVQIDSALRGLRSRLEMTGDRLIDEFKQTTRKETYRHIEKSISNDTFKSVLKRGITDNQEQLAERLPLVMDNELKSFESELLRIVKRFQEQTEDLFGMYDKLGNSGFDSHFDLDIQLDSGIDVKSLLFTLIGGGLLFWNPAGWVVLGPALASLAFQFYKAVRSFFSSNYKSAQQKKSTDENLAKVARQMQDSLHTSLSESLQDLETKISQVKTALEHPIEHVKQIDQVLASSEQDLARLSKALQKVLSNE